MIIFQVYIDANPVGADTSGNSNGLSSLLNKMTIGCKYDGSTFTGHSSAIYDEVALWLQRFNDTNRLVWMMGGWGEMIMSELFYDVFMFFFMTIIVDKTKSSVILGCFKLLFPHCKISEILVKSCG